ncbi:MULTISPECIES: nuclear transport factor 2 family protein [unclassified Rhodococcus (in: high G+C Gram-positive bacteria)]|uniref:nuclear transport factor 2 family protein n=1 Tax=unclassified Rhodococcus (in: high G+C Gram-positive bacteria) TaxID=192944 RepID=UPI0016811982|nr:MULTISPECIES: nuclear transport factor 2 family protein [unclassified Rhodococcus (in: high G+C Gram-positive bacteria)]
MTTVPTNPIDASNLSDDEKTIVDLEIQMAAAQDVHAITQLWSADAVYYDFGPGRFRGRTAATEEIGEQFKNVSNIRTRILELDVVAGETVAYAFSIQNYISDSTGGPLNFIIRATDVFVKTDGQWQVTHQHLSVPTNLSTGEVILTSEFQPLPAQ